MNLINMKTREYPVTPEELHRRFPGAPYPIPPSQLFRYGYAEVRQVAPPVPGEFQQAVEIAPEKVTGIYWRQKWEVIDYFTADEQAEKAIVEKKALAGTDYKSMIRRRAKKLESEGKNYEALLTLKKIGE